MGAPRFQQNITFTFFFLLFFFYIFCQFLFPFVIFANILRQSVKQFLYLIWFTSDALPSRVRTVTMEFRSPTHPPQNPLSIRCCRL